MIKNIDKTDYNFQKRTVAHLKKEGFNCIVQPKLAFPEIVAWKPFINSQGDTLALNVQENLSGKITNKILLPFYVSFIECRVNKRLSKKEKEIAKIVLLEGRCNTFLVAYKKNKKLLFQEIRLNNKEITITEIDKVLPSYIT